MCSQSFVFVLFVRYAQFVRYPDFTSFHLSANSPNLHKRFLPISSFYTYRLFIVGRRSSCVGLLAVHKFTFAKFCYHKIVAHYNLFTRTSSVRFELYNNPMKKFAHMSCEQLEVFANFLSSYAPLTPLLPKSSTRKNSFNP